MRPSSGSLLALALAVPLACGRPAAPGPDAAARALVQDLRSSLSRGLRPGGAAVRELQELARAHPDDPAISQLVLDLLPSMREWGGLASWLEAKAELTQEERIALAKVYVNLADFDAAWRTIRPLAEREPAALEANALAGRAAYLRGDAAAARLHLDRVWDQLVQAGRVEEQSYRAMLWLDEGELERAQAILTEALARGPDSIHVHNALARALAAAGDEAGAARHQQRAGELQAQLSAQEQRLLRRAAQNARLNQELERGDLDALRGLAMRFLLEADEQRATELLSFLESAYRAAGRSAELAPVLEEARALVPPSQASRR